MYIAHWDEEKQLKPHSLEHHTEEVTEFAVQFSKHFDNYNITEIISILHDEGKKTPNFSQYIRATKKVRGSVQHAAGGAFAILELKAVSGFVDGLALLIIGHHAGIPNINALEDKLRNAPDELKAIAPLAEQEIKEVEPLLIKGTNRLFEKQKQLSATEWDWYFTTLLRFCFSSLVDGDWLSTEKYFNPKKYESRAYYPLDFQDIINNLFTYVDNKQQNSTADPALIELRRDVFNAATNAGLKDDNFFTLYAPTGTGKTLASLSFALHHAKKYGKKRIIYALPLTNLTEQTSKELKNIFGAREVVEHHSRIDFDDINEEMKTMRLATENWNRLSIVTTSVELFESLFSNRPSKVRKLHRIANSVLILDEFQKIPLKLLKPIFMMLRTLREHFGVTVLCMSATPLPLTEAKRLGDVGLPLDIIPEYETLFQRMKNRVDYQMIEETLEADEFIEHMASHDNVLAIVNTRKDAQMIFKGMKKKKCWDKIFHLSTTMCSDHRSRVIQQISEIMDSNAKGESFQSIAVVSTSVLESGINLDFPAVYRMMAPLDALIQAAGRVNREAKLNKGVLYIFQLKAAENTDKNYQQLTEQTEKFLKRHEGTSVFHSPEKVMQYFYKIYKGRGVTGLDNPEIEGMLYQFQDVSRVFQMIEDNRVSVICRAYGSYDETNNHSKTSRAWLRTMQKYMIPLDKRHLNDASIQLEDGIYYLNKNYDEDMGFIL